MGRDRGLDIVMHEIIGPLVGAGLLVGVVAALVYRIFQK